MYVVVYLCCSFCMVRVMTKIHYPLIFSQSALNLSFMYKLVRSTNVNMLGAQHSAPIEDHCVLIIAHSIHVWIMYSANKLQTSNCWFKWTFFRMNLFGESDFSGKNFFYRKVKLTKLNIFLTVKSLCSFFKVKLKMCAHGAIQTPAILCILQFAMVFVYKSERRNCPLNVLPVLMMCITSCNISWITSSNNTEPCIDMKCT